MSNNLNIYEQVREVPKNAQTPIGAGRLKGKTDINPMWRLKKLTELFGPCGIGWKYKIKEKRLEQGSDNQIAAFVDIDLYFKHNGEWSEPIPGTGGSSFVTKEKSGLYTSDECFKMALTDAISVACKALGIGADIYWNEKTKYSKQETSSNTTNGVDKPNKNDREKRIKELVDIAHKKGYNEKAICKKANISNIKFIKNEQITSFKAGFEKLPDKEG